MDTQLVHLVLMVITVILAGLLWIALNIIISAIAYSLDAQN